MTVFFFHPLTMSSYYCPLVSMVSNEKSATNLLEETLYLRIVLFCFCCFHDSLSVFWQFGYETSRCGSLQLCPTWRLLNFLGIHTNVFHQIWEVFCHNFFKYSFHSFLSLLSFRNLHCVYVGILDGEPQISEALFIFLYSFCSSDWGESQLTCLKFTGSSASSNVLFTPSSKFFISVIALFNLKMSVWVF